MKNMVSCNAASKATLLSMGTDLGAADQGECLYSTWSQWDGW